MVQRQVKRSGLPKEVEGLQPFRFSEISHYNSRTIIFLSAEDAAKLRGELSALDSVPRGGDVEGKPKRRLRENLMVEYSSKSPYLIKKIGADELKNTREINASLAAQGVPTVEVVGEYQPRKDSNYIIVPREKTLAYTQLFEGGLTYDDMGSYFHSLGCLHAAGFRHGHAHFGNAFKRDGGAGLFDFDSVSRVGTDFDWNNYKSVFGFFYQDYKKAMGMLYRAYREKKPNLDWPAQGGLNPLFTRLVEPLPTTPQIKAQLVSSLKRGLVTAAPGMDAPDAREI